MKKLLALLLLSPLAFAELDMDEIKSVENELNMKSLKNDLNEINNLSSNKIKKNK